ncbi:uncharacterized protein PRCAT00002983001 [Priceomyces carsonii]|uniref:uncharacterized protein n=1 Tax=Priceomyces carsonii TaxID=28549 RepID=UPI002EDB622B|nr:unnamed protein product [Priceomyces carsonii]
MDNVNDTRLRNFKSISLRNLYLPSSSGTNETINQRPRESPRRNLSRSISVMDASNSGVALMNRYADELLDSFFTVHVLKSQTSDLQLVYVSEVIKENMEPDFNEITIPLFVNSGKLKFVLKIWTRSSILQKEGPEHTWKLLHLLNMDLRKLIYVGLELEKLGNIFQTNSVIIKLRERYYTLPECLVTVPEDIKKNHVDNGHKPFNSSYSVDSIRAICNLTKSVKELSFSKLKLSSQISQLIGKWVDPSNLSNVTFNLPQAQSRNKTLEAYISKQEAANDHLASRISSISVKITEWSKLNSDIDTVFENLQLKIKSIEAHIVPIEEDMKTVLFPSLAKRLLEMTNAIQEMITIGNIDNSFRLTIMGLEFPQNIRELLDICYYNHEHLINFNADDIDIDITPQEEHSYKIEQINAGLAYIIQLIEAVAFITMSHLKYKMISNGNQSFIVDTVCFDDESREQSTLYAGVESDGQGMRFPLYYDPNQVEKVSSLQKGSSIGEHVLMNRPFEHGLRLLNRNLIYLINNVTDIYNSVIPDIKDRYQVSTNIPPDCLDNFLWNLQYLTLFITAPSNCCGKMD